MRLPWPYTNTLLTLAKKFVRVFFYSHLGDSLAVELSTLTRAAKVRILVPQPLIDAPPDDPNHPHLDFHHTRPYGMDRLAHTAHLSPRPLDFAPIINGLHTYRHPNTLAPSASRHRCWTPISWAPKNSHVG